MSDMKRSEVSRRSFLMRTGSAMGGAALADRTLSAAEAAPVKLTLLDPTGAQEEIILRSQCG
jgi:hypothetical protein